MMNQQPVQQPEDGNGADLGACESQMENYNLAELGAHVEEMLGQLGTFRQPAGSRESEQEELQSSQGLVMLSQALAAVDGDGNQSGQLQELLLQEDCDLPEEATGDASPAELSPTMPVDGSQQQEAPLPPAPPAVLVEEPPLPPQPVAPLEMPAAQKSGGGKRHQAEGGGRGNKHQPQWRAAVIPGLEVGSTVMATVSEISSGAEGLEGLHLTLPGGLNRHLHKAQLPGRTPQQKQDWLASLSKGQKLPVEIVSSREEVRRQNDKTSPRREVLVSVRSALQRQAFQALSCGDTVKGVVACSTTAGEQREHTGWDVDLDNYLTAWVPKSEVDHELQAGETIEAAVFSLEELPIIPKERPWPVFKVRLAVKSAERARKLRSQASPQEQSAAFAALTCGDTVEGVVAAATVRKRDQVHTGWEVRLPSGLMAWVPASESGRDLQPGETVQAVVIELQERKPEPGKRSATMYSVKLTIKNAESQRWYFQNLPLIEARRQAAEGLLGSLYGWSLVAPVGGFTDAVLKVGEIELQGKVRLFVSSLPNNQLDHEQRKEILRGYAQRQEPLLCKALRFNNDNHTLELEWHPKPGDLQLSNPDNPDDVLTVGDVVPVKVSEVGGGVATLQVETPLGTAYGTAPEDNAPGQVNFVIPEANS